MSTGLECQIIEVERDWWFYILQDGNCPARCWDWREYATAYGPFSSQQAAERHLDDSHANPGGYSVLGLPDGRGKLDLEADPCLKALIDRAESPVRRSIYRPRWY